MARERGYEFVRPFLMDPPSCTTKNHILVGKLGTKEKKNPINKWVEEPNLQMRRRTQLTNEKKNPINKWEEELN